MHTNNHQGTFDKLGLATMRKWSKEIIQEQTSSPEHNHPWADVALVLGYLNATDKGMGPKVFVHEELHASVYESTRSASSRQRAKLRSSCAQFSDSSVGKIPQKPD